MTIFNPDDSEVTEIVLPDGSQAGEVVAPDGSVVWTAAADIPDLGDYQWPVDEGSGTTLNPSVGSVSATTDGSWTTETGPVGDNYLALADAETVTTDASVGSTQQITVFGWMRPQLSTWGRFDSQFVNNQDFADNEDGWGITDESTEGLINTVVGDGTRSAAIEQIQFVNSGVWGFFALFQDGSTQRVITWDNSTELEDTGFVDVGKTPNDQNDSLLWGTGQFGNAAMDIGIHGKANSLLSKTDLTGFWQSTQR